MGGPDAGRFSRGREVRSVSGAAPSQIRSVAGRVVESFLEKIYVEGPRSLDKDDRGVYYGLTH